MCVCVCAGGGEDAFLDALCEVLSECNRDDYLILAGDFNCTESDSDRNHLEPHSASLKRLIQLINHHELWKLLKNSDGSSLGHTHAVAPFFVARLDRFYGFRHHLKGFRTFLIIA